MNEPERPSTIPFRPAIHPGEKVVDSVDQFSLETGMVVVGPATPMTGRFFHGADKVRFYVAFPSNLNQRYEVRGEFHSGIFDDDGGEVAIQLYANNEISQDLNVFHVRLPLAFISDVLTRAVSRPEEK